jgi:hypothetical protein
MPISEVLSHLDHYSSVTGDDSVELNSKYQKKNTMLANILIRIASEFYGIELAYKRSTKSNS